MKADPVASFPFIFEALFRNHNRRVAAGGADNPQFLFHVMSLVCCLVRS